MRDAMSKKKRSCARATMGRSLLMHFLHWNLPSFIEILTWGNWLPIAWQESIDKGNASSDEGANQEGEQSSDNSDSCSVSVAVQSDDEEEDVKPKKPAAPKFRATGKTAPPCPKIQTPTKPANPAGGEKPARRSSGVNSAEKKKQAEEALLQQGEKHLQMLQELRPEVLWRSLVRTSEITRRLGKSPALEAELQATGAEQAAKIAENISSLTTTLASMQEVMKAVRQGDNDQVAAEVKEGMELKGHVKACIRSLFEDESVLVQMIQCIAKKVLEACLLSRNFHLHLHVDLELSFGTSFAPFHAQAFRLYIFGSVL